MSSVHGLTLIAASLAGIKVVAGNPVWNAGGCGVSHTPGYHFADASGNLSVSTVNGPRYYSVQVPRPYNQYHRYPLIFDYHGNTETSLIQRDNSAYYNYTQDYIVVYPQGYDRHWQGPTYAVPGIDDLAFTTDLLAHIKSNYCIDSERVYASGKSNGGGFVDTLACSDAGNSFAAFAMASAALYTDTSLSSCSKKRAILEAHSHNDTTIPYAPTKPGSGGPLPDIDDWISWWAERDCGDHAHKRVDTRPIGYNITSFSCGRWRDVVNLYQLAGGGHCWPSVTGTNSDALAKPECRNERLLDFTHVVLDFFGKWSLRNAPR